MNRRSRERSAGDSLEGLLQTYAAAAVAAGVGLLGLGPVSQAKIVYTPANQSLSPNNRVPLDLNHDGKNDFFFSDTGGGTTFGGGWGFLTVFPARVANRIFGAQVGDGGFWRYASALSAGITVGPKQGKAFTPGNKLMLHTSSNQGLRRHQEAANSTYYCAGPWKNANKRYLGLKFLINGKTHYGWARLNVFCANLTVYGTLTGYAYETVANKAIVTGKEKGADNREAKPARSQTLGQLAAGAAGGIR